MSEHVVVLTTAGSREEAGRIATSLVENRLAACASLVPGVTSVYWWKGEVTQSEEVLVVIKTRGARADEAVAHLQSIHSYEVPEVLVLGIEGGSGPYLAWIDDVCSA